MSRPPDRGTVEIALVGAGKIAADQHRPALTAQAAFRLVGTVDPARALDGLPNYPSLDVLRASHPGVRAVAVCTPPQFRHGIARAALRAGLHVFLEKPPCATVSQAEDLADVAREAGLTLFAAWHSRCAPGVAPAAAWLSGRAPSRVTVTWKEDARRWHPGQDWLWRPGGMGVFDPGINALSIVTRILPPTLLHAAHIEVPVNRQAPIAATLDGTCGPGATLHAEFDFRQAGPPIWEIEVETEGGARVVLSAGGHSLSIDGAAVTLAPAREYAGLYTRFAALIEAGEREVDLRPLQLVTDAFAIAGRSEVAAFFDDDRAR